MKTMRLFHDWLTSFGPCRRAACTTACATIAVLFFGPALLQAQPAVKEKDRLEQSVDKALLFLATMQEVDGSWHHWQTRSPAVTSLSIMAFLSAGHLPDEGPYGETIASGIRWILSQQQPSGLITGSSGMDMYHHGISTLMLAEVMGMTDAKLARELRPKFEKAVNVILTAQIAQANASQGGWRYMVQSHDADVSVTGWQLLALRAAKNLGCDVPAERIELALGFLGRCRDATSGGFCYTPGGRVTMSCTGTGVLSLELAGKERRHSRESLQAGSFILKHPPRWGDEHFSYAVYYCSQATFQLGNNYWNFYRPQMHKVFFDYQNQNGSWLSNDAIGPVYNTAMAVLALTVEYRFLPIYQRHEEK